jgi:hypothetical protein
MPQGRFVSALKARGFRPQQVAFRSQGNGIQPLFTVALGMCSWSYSVIVTVVRERYNTGRNWLKYSQACCYALSAGVASMLPNHFEASSLDPA